MAVKHILDPELFLPSEENINNPSFWLRLLTIPQKDSFLIRPHAYREFVTRYTSDNLGALRSPRDIQKSLARLMGKIDDEEVEDVNSVAENIKYYSPSLGCKNNPTILKDDLASLPQDSYVVLATEVECWPRESNFSKSGLFLHTDNFSETQEADKKWKLKERESFLRSDPSIEEIAEKGHTLFPHLRFCQSAWDQVGKIQGDPKETRRRIIQHLCILNDEALRICDESTEGHTRIRAFGAANVVASPENGKVLSSKKYMKTRTFKFYQPDSPCECDQESCEGHAKECHWHTKLYPKTGRIYFTVEDGVVYIGTITDHLPLPGKKD